MPADPRPLLAALSSLSAIEWQAVLDAMLHTVQTCGLVSDAHMRAQPKIIARRDAAKEAEARHAR